MKKIRLILLFVLFCNLITAQKYNVGLTFSGGLNMTKVNTEKYNARNGTDLNVGINIVKNYNQHTGFNFGFEFNQNNFSYINNEKLFYFYDDKMILSKENENEKTNKFEFKERTYKAIYITIPTLILIRSNELKYSHLRIISKFGMKHSFNLKNNVTDISPTEIKHEDFTLNKDLALYNGSIGISGGVETTFQSALNGIIEIGYYYGYMNIHRGNALFGDKDKNKTSIILNSNPLEYRNYTANQHQIELKLTILF